MVDISPFKNVRQLRDSVHVMYNTFLEIFQANLKKRALSEGSEMDQVGQGKDTSL
jgi:hypothetical protein